MTKHIARRTILKGAIASAVTAPASASTGVSSELEALIEQHGRIQAKWDVINGQLDRIEADPAKPPHMGVYEFAIQPQSGFPNLSDTGVWCSEDQIRRRVDFVISNLERDRDGGIPAYSQRTKWIRAHQAKIDKLNRHKAAAIDALRRAQAPRRWWLRDNHVKELEDRCTELAGEVWELEARIAAHPCRSAQEVRRKAMFLSDLIEAARTDRYADHFPALLRSLIEVGD